MNNFNTIVERDGTGSFSAGTISITDEVASGIITASAGSAAAPSLKFAGSTNTGLSAATANKLSFDSNGVEKMSINSTDIVAATRFTTTNVRCNQAIQVFTVTANNQSVTANATTSILLLKTTAARTGLTITFPASPTNGQYFTILLGSTFSITVTNAGNGASIVNGTTTYSSSPGQAATSYLYYAPDNSWYRERTS
jgi:hypothetical protein